MWVNRERYEHLLVDEATYRIQAELLRESVRALTEQLTAERLRAENAIDQLLARGGEAPISPTRVHDVPSMFEEDPEELRKLREEIEVTGIVEALKQHAS